MGQWQARCPHLAPPIFWCLLIPIPVWRFPDGIEESQHEWGWQSPGRACRDSRDSSATHLTTSMGQRSCVKGRGWDGTRVQHGQDECARATAREPQEPHGMCHRWMCPRLHARHMALHQHRGLFKERPIRSNQPGG